MLWQIFLADYRERVRRYSFLATLTFVFFFGLLVITGKFGIFVNQCRGELNSAWVGTSMATGAAVMTSLVGFYLVKNCLRRDRLTGVGQILAASSLGNTTYFVAKYISNVMTLFTMIALLIVAAVMMQLMGSHPADINLWELLSPFLIIVLPVAVLVSAVALLFESIGFLSRGLGNVAYFFTMPLWFSPIGMDAPGMRLILPSMQAAASAAYPDRPKGFLTGFVGFAGQRIEDFPLFHWDGIDWTMEMILPRLLYIALAVVIVFVAVPFFDRFDTSRRLWPVRSSAKPSEDAPESRQSAPIGSAANMRTVVLQFGFVSQFVAEINLLLRRVTIRWQIVALALVAAQLFVPYSVLRTYIAPAVWIWPLLIWSSMGGRERIHNTESLVFSSAHPLGRQFAALWLAGVAVTLACGSGTIVRAVLVGDIAYLGVLLSASVFVPTMALAFGAISGGSQLFEVVYVFLWYVGPINRMPAVDFLATTDDAMKLGVPLVFFVITAFLLPTAIFIRRRRLGM